MAAGDDRWGMWERALERGDALEILQASATYTRYLEAVTREAVRVARAEGRTWEEIAQSLGVAKQSAWRKYESKGEVWRQTVKGFLDFGVTPPPEFPPSAELP